MLKYQCKFNDIGNPYLIRNEFDFPLVANDKQETIKSLKKK